MTNPKQTEVKQLTRYELYEWVYDTCHATNDTRRGAERETGLIWGSVLKLLVPNNDVTKLEDSPDVRLAIDKAVATKADYESIKKVIGDVRVVLMANDGRDWSQRVQDTDKLLENLIAEIDRLAALQLKKEKNNE